MCSSFFQIKAIQPFLVTYLHTVVLETLNDNVKLKFFYLSVVWNYYTYTYSFLDNVSHTVCERFRFPQQFGSFVFGLNGQTTIKIDA